MNKVEYRPKRKVRTSRIVRVVVLLFLAMYMVYHELTLALAQADELDDSPEYQQRLQYGQILFPYFQQDAMATLQAIALAEKQGIAATDQQHITLIKGAASIQANMPAQASNIFTTLRDKLDDPELATKATYWSAHLAFAQQNYSLVTMLSSPVDWQEAEDYLEPGQLDQWVYQHAFVLQHQQNSQWQAELATLPADSRYRSYLHFNHAVSLLSQSQWQAGMQALDLAQAPLAGASSDAGWFGWFSRWSSDQLADAETLALADRIHLLRGQVHAEQGRSSDALQAFTAVRQHAMESEQALLRYGWMLAEQQRIHDAMSVWQYLYRERTSMYAVQASHAMAWGFEQLGAETQAFAQLEATATALETALTSAADLANASLQASFYTQLARVLAEQNDQELGAIWPSQHRDLLVTLLAGDVSSQLNHLSRLDQHATELLAYQRRAAAMQNLLDERVAERSRRLTSLDASSPKSQLLALKQQHEKLSEQVLKAQQSNDGKLFADSSQKAQLARLARAESLITALDAEKRARYQARLDRLQGVLKWQLQETYSARLWEAQKQLNQVGELIEQGYQQLARIERIRLQGADIVAQQTAITELGTQLADVQITQSLMASRVVEELALGIGQSLAERQELLSRQLSQTRLAMLRMQDNSLVAAAGEQP